MAYLEHWKQSGKFHKLGKGSKEDIEQFKILCHKTFQQQNSRHLKAFNLKDSIFEKHGEKSCPSQNSKSSPIINQM